MKEKEFETILEQYPELIEEGLANEDRRGAIGRRHMDLPFKDKIGHGSYVSAIG